MQTLTRILAFLVLAALCGCGSGSGFSRPTYFVGAVPTTFGGTDGGAQASQLIASEILGNRRFDLSPVDWVIETGPVSSTSENIDNDFGAGEGDQQVVSSTGSIDMRIISREAAISEVRLFGLYDIGEAALANSSAANSFTINWTVSWQDLTNAYSVTCNQSLTGAAFQDTTLF
jgi:hypothetical protein